MLELHDLKKEYRTGSLVQKALNSVSLNFRDNEFVAILGPSGSGKTTLLNIIGGLDSYDSGDLIIDNISTKKYKDKDWDAYRNHTIGFIFQSYNLIMHQTILANVELALTISGNPKAQRRDKALAALESVGLKEQAHKKPNQLSGGQMQRVAIARALVNDPRILLADEPTGALDSNTSIQVMDLLKEVAKDRLVIMVTHNPDLAYQYATRIVELKDGDIVSDSDPYQVPSESEVRHDRLGKASMSFLTALSLSFSNLKTKKARTFLTSFAGSIGIIGIALILALSNGVSDYIQTIEEDTMSEYPLTIQSSSFSITSMMQDSLNSALSQKGEDEIGVSKLITSMFAKIGSNDLGSLKEELETNDALKEYVKAIEYDFDDDPLIYSSNLDDIHQVHPDRSFNSIGLGSNVSSNNMMSSMMSTDIFHKLPSDEKLYLDDYTLKAGHWPKNYDECVLVLTANGNVSDFIIYALDLRDYQEMKDMINDFANDIESPEVTFSNYRYEDFIGKSFKIVNRSDLYEYDETYDIYIDRSDDEEYLKDVLENSEDLKIVGIVAPKEDGGLLTSGINYLPELSEYVSAKALDSEILKKQLAQKDIDVFTGKEFGSKEELKLDMSSFFSIDEKMLESAFGLNSDILQAAIKEIDMSDFDLGLEDIVDIDIDRLLEGISTDLISQKSGEVVTDIADAFVRYCIENPIVIDMDELTPQPSPTQTPDPTDEPSLDEDGDSDDVKDPASPAIDFEKLADILRQYTQNFFNSADGQRAIEAAMQKLLYDTGVIETIQDNIDDLIKEISPKIEEAITSSIEDIMLKAADKLKEVFPEAVEIDADKIKNAFKFNLSEEKLNEIMSSQILNESASYENNLTKLGYVDYDEPSSIAIYPKDFEAKEEIIGFLNEYNARMEKEAPEKVISFTDYVGTLMSSVTTIIDVISYVLIAFVSISLIVSSIMIGVITYISVLERKKEIGILRAIGASKCNISSVFNAETFIVGLLSGLIGVGFSLLILIPANALIHSIAGTNDINAKLPLIPCITLILLSIVLTLIGGIIPSRKAANSDPVEALRQE